MILLEFDQMDAPSTWMTRREAAAWLGISVPTLQRRVGERQIEVAKIGNRHLFSPEALERYVARHTVPADDDGPEATGPTVTTHGDGVAAHDGP